MSRLESRDRWPGKLPKLSCDVYVFATAHDDIKFVGGAISIVNIELQWNSISLGFPKLIDLSRVEKVGP